MSETSETTQPVEENSAMKEMRGAIERKTAENAELRGQVLDGHLQGIGLESGRGLGKAIAAGYDGDLTVEAVTAFANSEYDYTPQVTPPAAEQAATQQAQADGFGSASAPLSPQGPEDVIAAHDQRLAAPEATRRDAMNALEAKVQHYPVFTDQQ